MYKKSVVRKDTGVSPKSHPLLGEGRHMGKLPPEDHSHPGVPFRVCDTFANTGKIGSILGGTKRTPNSTKQTRVITGCIGHCSTGAETRKHLSSRPTCPDLSPLKYGYLYLTPAGPSSTWRQSCPLLGAISHTCPAPHSARHISLKCHDGNRGSSNGTQVTCSCRDLGQACRFSLEEFSGWDSFGLALCF